MLTWSVVLGVTLLAGFCQGLTGFGFALVFAPIASLVLPARQVVVATMVIGSLMTALVLWQSRRSFPLQASWPLLAGGVIGAPAGSVLLIVSSSRVLHLMIAGVALVIVTTFVLRRPRPSEHESALLGAAGVLGGFLNGSTSMGGGIPALLLVTQRWEVVSARAALLSFNLTSYAVAIISSLLGGLPDPITAMNGALLPVAVVAGLGGSAASSRIPTQLFYRVMIAVVIVTSVGSIVAYLVG